MEHFDFINLLPRSVPLDIDPRFPFLTKRPEIEDLLFADSCNGLVLFDHVRKSNLFDILSYIVCNPATKQWETVLTCSCCLPLADCCTFLAFDPAVSSHFHLIRFQGEALDDEDEVFVLSVFAYSSETGTWSRNQTNWNEQGQLEGWCTQCYLSYWSSKHAFFNGVLHLLPYSFHHDQIVALDVQGKTQRIITIPAAAEGRRGEYNGYMGHSQGRLHYINKEFNSHGCNQSYVLSIWVLQDYDRQEWLLKDTVSFLKLSGKKSCTGSTLDFFVVAIHQDCNVVFILQPLNRLIAYDMDRKEVSVIATFEHDNLGVRIAPYVPYFLESQALANKL